VPLFARHLLRLALVLPLIVSGCVSRFAGSQLLTAPNQRVPASEWKPLWKSFITSTKTNPFTPISIEVGPPTATLRALVTEPGDFHCRFATETRTTNGHESFSLMWRLTTNTFRPSPDPATIILLHGYGLSKESMAPWALALAQEGYRAVAVDLRGHGESTGAQIGFGKYEPNDLRQMLDSLLARGICNERVVVMGISYGATMALHWAAIDARIRSVVAIAPYNQPEEAMVRFVEMQNLHVPERVVRGGAYSAAYRLNLKWDELSGEAAMRRITQPVLLIGGDADTVSRPEDLRAMQSVAAGKTKTVIVPGAVHQTIGFRIDTLLPEITDWLAKIHGRG
jgi:pimeloyl-ACP methyl ester carboxylesterase